MISASDSYTGAVWIMHQMVWREKAVSFLEQLKVAVNDKYQVIMVGWSLFHIHYGFPCVCFESAGKLLLPTTGGKLLTSRPATQFAKLPRLILYLDKYRLALSGPMSTPLPLVIGGAQVNSFWTTYGKYVRSVVLKNRKEIPYLFLKGFNLAIKNQETPLQVSLHKWPQISAQSEFCTSWESTEFDLFLAG